MLEDVRTEMRNVHKTVVMKRGERTLGRKTHKWKDNTERVLIKQVVKMWIEFNWLIIISGDDLM